MYLLKVDNDLILDMGNSENTKEMEAPERESLSSGFGSAIGVPLRIFVGHWVSTS